MKISSKTNGLSRKTSLTFLKCHLTSDLRAFKKTKVKCGKSNANHLHDCSKGYISKLKLHRIRGILRFLKKIAMLVLGTCKGNLIQFPWSFQTSFNFSLNEIMISHIINDQFANKKPFIHKIFFKKTRKLDAVLRWTDQTKVDIEA
jgi:hypothetical protein